MPVDLADRERALENEYFHRKEKELIERMRAKLALENAQPSGIKCPRCDGQLMEADYEHVKIDVCDKCHGVWFDAGELTQVIDKDKQGGWFARLFG
jgi:uncharacterized protein